MKESQHNISNAHPINYLLPDSLIKELAQHIWFLFLRLCSQYIGIFTKDSLQGFTHPLENASIYCSQIILGIKTRYVVLILPILNIVEKTIDWMNGDDYIICKIRSDSSTDFTNFPNNVILTK